MNFEENRVVGSHGRVQDAETFANRRIPIPSVQFGRQKEVRNFKPTGSYRRATSIGHRDGVGDVDAWQPNSIALLPRSLYERSRAHAKRTHFQCYLLSGMPEQSLMPE